MKYKVEITETLKRVVEVEAGCPSHALVKVKEEYKAEKIILDSFDYESTKFEVIENGS